MKYIVIERPNGVVTIVRSECDSPSEPPLSEHEQIINELFNKLKKLNVEIRESCKEFCTCGHYGIEKVKYCSKCGKEVRLPLQNSLERT